MVLVDLYSHVSKKTLPTLIVLHLDFKIIKFYLFFSFPSSSVMIFYWALFAIYVLIDLNVR